MAEGPKKAVALSYDPQADQAPVLTAAGEGALAREIIRLAQEHGVPIHEDPDLVEVLAALDVGTIIPPELYTLVAEVLAFVYQVNAARRERFLRLARTQAAGCTTSRGAPAAMPTADISTSASGCDSAATMVVRAGGSAAQYVA